MNLPDTERAYIAGLIDGEGSIGCTFSNSQYILFISVEMCDGTAVQLLHKYYGGSFRSVAAKHENHRSSWVWKTTGFGCVSVLRDIEPFMKVKARQVQLALEFINTLKPLNDKTPFTDEQLKARRRISKKLKHLNRRGPRENLGR